MCNQAIVLPAKNEIYLIISASGRVNFAKHRFGEEADDAGACRCGRNSFRTSSSHRSLGLKLARQIGMGRTSGPVRAYGFRYKKALVNKGSFRAVAT